MNEKQFPSEGTTNKLPSEGTNNLFEQARSLPQADRAKFLDSECPDAALRAHVETLLAAEAPPGSSLDGPEYHLTQIEPKNTVTFQTTNPAAGSTIAGKYTLLDPIGEGGMGSVWRANQTEPVNRVVAVKLIKAGMDSKQVLARFEAERQALALMDHPNIAKVLDGGLHEGRPFFVMELVNGTPITQFCDTKQLTPQQRLELFVQACQAIQHAHQKGIIHRDIKPSNVLVTQYDEKPVVKVIDFGVAKATGGVLTESTIETGFGGVVGTPQYMSPEQATANNLDIDTRSDVYSLGVLLYELLTGSPPFSRKELERKGLLEILRVVREEDPPRPSTKLSSSDALPSLSANRSIEPKQLTGLLRRELDWIVMKALEKDRTRRYETANGFAADVLRYLSGEPVVAHPPSTAYRLRKFVRRNRSQVIAASLVLLALIAGVIGTTLGLLEANRQTVVAKAETKEKEKARMEEARQRGIAQDNEKVAKAEKGKALAAAQKERKAREDEQRERKFAEAIATFVKDDFLGLTSVEGQDRFGGEFGSEGLDRTATLMTLLDRAAAKLKARKDLDPRIEAELNWIVGVNFRAAGEAVKGIPFLEKALELRRVKLGAENTATLSAMNSLGVCYTEAGQFGKALQLLDQTYKQSKAILGPEDPTTLAIMSNLAISYQKAGQLNLALPLLEETHKLTKAKNGLGHLRTIESMNNLAIGYLASGELIKALPLLEETHKLMLDKLGPDDPKTLGVTNNLAVSYKNASQVDKALQLYETTLELLKDKLGPDHPETLKSMNNLALGYQASGQTEKALPLYEETIKLKKAKLGPNHPDTLISINNLAQGYQAAGYLDQALPLLEDTLNKMKVVLGPDHPETLKGMNNLAGGYLAAGQVEKALPLLEETLELQKAKLGLDHPDTILIMNNLAGTYLDAGQHDKALPLFEETLKLISAKLGADHPDTLGLMHNLGLGFYRSGQLDKALTQFEQTLKLRRENLGPEHRDTLNTLSYLGKAYCDARQGDKAVPLMKEFVDIMRKQFPEEHPQFAGLLAQVSLELLNCGQHEAAAGIIRESLDIREKWAPDHWTTFNTQSMLGAALLGQKKYPEAEPLLIKGYEGLKAREETIPPEANTRIPEALDRLIELYTATNKPAEAEKYRLLRAMEREP